MRLWAEERNSGTIELLLTQPITLWQAVLGKFLAAWLFVAIALALTFPIWVTVNFLGNPDNGAIFAAYLGSLLMAGGYLAIGSCMSALTRSQVIALILSVALSTGIYLLLQVAFLGSVPAAMVAHGWKGIDKLFALPFHDIAIALGLGWLAFLVVCDAVVSPSGCGNIYMNATPRVVYGWARGGTFFKLFTRVDEKSGIPRPALWLTFALAIFWMLPFPSWSAMINVVSAALVLSYAVAPITTAALRRTAPGLPRPFRVRGFAVLGPLSFVIAALIVFWSGWKTVSWLLGVQIVLYVLYVPYRAWRTADRGALAQDVRASLWLVGFYWLMIGVSWLGTFGGKGLVGAPWDSLLVAGVALGVYKWGARTGLPFLQHASADDGD